MSKFDGEIRAAGEGSVELQELLAALGRSPQLAVNRQDALAHYLSGKEGWSDARDALRGAFAKPSGRGTGLTGEQDK